MASDRELYVNLERHLRNGCEVLGLHDHFGEGGSCEGCRMLAEVRADLADMTERPSIQPDPAYQPASTERPTDG